MKYDNSTIERWLAIFEQEADAIKDNAYYTNLHWKGRNWIKDHGWHPRKLASSLKSELPKFRESQERSVQDAAERGNKGHEHYFNLTESNDAPIIEAAVPLLVATRPILAALAGMTTAAFLLEMNNFGLIFLGGAVVVALTTLPTFNRWQAAKTSLREAKNRQNEKWKTGQIEESDARIRLDHDYPIAEAWIEKLRVNADEIFGEQPIRGE